MKRDLGKKVVISLELGLRIVFSDYIGGISYIGNSEKNDWYIFGGLIYLFRFGFKDVDNDGIVDKEDRCFCVVGSYLVYGCFDRDGDGVEDLEDVCFD